MMTPSIASFHVADGHPSFAGHFPGQPLLPGVLLLAQTLEAVLEAPALRDRVGPAPRLASAKFLAPVRPGETVEIGFELRPAWLDFQLRCGARVVARGRFAIDPASADSPGTGGPQATENSA